VKAANTPEKLAVHRKQTLLLRRTRFASLPLYEVLCINYARETIV